MKTLLTLSLLLISSLAWSQWTGPDAAYKISYTKGFVGIGTATPSYKFHLKTTDPATLFFAETNESQIMYTQSALDLRAKSTATRTPFISWYAPSGLMQGTLGSRTDALGLTLSNGNNFLIQGGNVGIGVDDPKGYLLAIGGKFIAEEVVVKLKMAWPDYVFKEDYSLLPLDDLHSFIKRNRHLPDVPTAEHVMNGGVNVGDMTCQLLRKVEELTLYLLAEHSRAEDLQKRISKLENGLQGPNE